MAFSELKPPMNIELERDIFNNLVETIISENNDCFKQKLLRYGVPNDNKNTVTFGLYPREVSMLIKVLANNLKQKENCLDYFETIKKIQEKLKEVKSDSEK